MPILILGVGSNILPQENILQALPQLERHFGKFCISPIYESPAWGFVGENFLNFVISAQVDCPLDVVVEVIKTIELAQGRKPEQEKFSSRYIDIDILMYGDFIGQLDSVILPREDILLYDFVLRPLADLHPDQRHPVIKKTFKQLWSEYLQRNNQSMQLRVSEFQLCGQNQQLYAG